MKEQVKNLYLKALLIGIKGIIVLPLIVFLIYEAFITQNQEAEMSHVQYVAVITTLCWILVLWTFVDYKLKHYLFSVLVITVFLQMYFLIFILEKHTGWIAVQTRGMFGIMTGMFAVQIASHGMQFKNVFCSESQ